MKRLLLVVAFLLVATPLNYSQELNEIPKYGGIKKTPEMVRIDNEFIDYMVKHFGSRDTAADDAIRRGFAFLAKADWRMAMKRFNQAWLLSPDKPEVPWGFGAALSYEGKFEHAEKVPGALDGKGEGAAQLFAQRRGPALLLEHLKRVVARAHDPLRLVDERRHAHRQHVDDDGLQPGRCGRCRQLASE